MLAYMIYMEEELKKFLEEGGDWEKMETSIPSVFIVRSPPTKTKGARVFVEINPVDEKGNPRKRKGLFVTDSDMLNQFAEVLLDENVQNLVKLIEKLNPKESAKEGKKLKLG
jgi:hypothetical protein